MRIVQCTNSHFFDADDYDTCPVCGCREIIHSQTDRFYDKTKSKGFKNRKKNKRKKKDPGILPAGYENFPVNTTLGCVKKFDFEQTGGYAAPGSSIINDDEKTSSFFNSCVQTYGNSQKTDLPANSNTDNNDDTFFSRETIDIQKEIKAISASSDDKTTGYFASRRTFNCESADNTDQRQLTDPVTGWLVAISGNHIGCSFNIYSGNNSIGRGSNNRIDIPMDSGISRTGHAFIVYDPKTSNFFIKTGGERGLTYVNGQLVKDCIEIKHYDVIELGESKFMFIPLCGSEFSWENYID